MLSKAIQWIVYSSSDPKKVSLTVKSAILGFGTLIVFVLPNTDIPLLADSTSQLIESVLVVVSVVAGIGGLIRKVLTSFTGANEVVKGWNQ